MMNLGSEAFCWLFGYWMMVDDSEGGCWFGSETSFDRLAFFRLASGFLAGLEFVFEVGKLGGLKQVYCVF